MTAALPPSLHETWVPVGSRTEDVSISLLSITAETTVYEHAETPKIGHCDIQPRSLLGIDVDLSPSLSALGKSVEDVMSLAADPAKERFVSLLDEEGITVQDERSVTEFDRGDGIAGRWYVFETTHLVGDARIDTETHLAAWPAGDRFVMAGGTIPLEAPPEDALQVGVEAEAEVGAEIHPTTDRETIAAFVRARVRETVDSVEGLEEVDAAAELDESAID
ncbi:hypothetical protein [Natronosalvus halobius]|uniref:hypothetical protein n=1 Tax=Natronosalvus halobius TaxID=2953746 RepID=UPI0020A1AD16|nr:hypothetical protein [Natronosalvus halobius]USZ71217.1 hypothetical protein NGM15_14190 [Natronosalvus halobius]